MFIGLLWPSAMRYSDNILSRIRKQYSVTSELYSFATAGSFKKFVVGIYKPDNTPMRRIMSKFKVMRKCNLVVNVMYIEIDNPEMIPHRKSRLRGTFYCRNMKSLKKAIRNKYKGKIKRYVHDVIIHISDNEEHNRRTKRLLDKFAQRVQ